MTKEIMRWADEAMYEAVPTNTDDSTTVEPTVKLITLTPDPLGVIAAACRMYEGKPVGRPIRPDVAGRTQSVTDDERIRYFNQMLKTRLSTPFEFVNLHFLIEGVSRAFTHQLVRTRMASYVQESQRFAVKTNGEHEVALPPSLAGTIPAKLWRAEHGSWIPANEAGERQHKRNLWDACVDEIAEAYNTLVNRGMPAEDARGLLPTNITTRIHFRIDYRNLLGIAGNRLCTQAQFEWRKVFSQIVREIENSGVYMAHELAKPLAPICYQTGKCEFMADMDRYCSIRERVEANHAINRPSTEWDKPDGPVAPIQPAEWLVDPASARRRR